jgi:hypothetical protein
MLAMPANENGTAPPREAGNVALVGAIDRLVRHGGRR